VKISDTIYFDLFVLCLIYFFVVYMCEFLLVMPYYTVATKLLAVVHISLEI
jgi:hypothetical protein